MRGSLTMFAGCMAAGKSALLLNRVSYLRSLKARVVVTLPQGPYGEPTRAVSRAGPSEYALRFRDADDLRKWARCEEMLAIDEIQDQDLWIVDVLAELKRDGRMIVAAGRDTNFRGEANPVMVMLKEIADEYMLLTAVCAVCRQKADRTQRLVRGEPAPWDSPIREQGPPLETYEPRCFVHHVVPGKPGI